MDRQPDAAVVDRIIEYCDRQNELGGEGLLDAVEPTQSIKVHSTQWSDHVKTMRLTGEVRSGVETAIDAIAKAGDQVDRKLLTSLARKAGDGTEGRIASWFTTMCWGAGPRKNYRVRQWRKALEWDRFSTVLLDTQGRVAQGQLVEAHQGAWMPGTGEAFFTKWLWALGLPGIPGGVTPYVLDARVRNSLSALQWWPEGRNKSHRWVDYCATLDRWAGDIRLQRPGWTATGNRIEQLFFERSRNNSDFYTWASG